MPNPNMMKIAIAGTNGLAQFIAYYLSQLTSHSFIFLTRAANPEYKERDWQALVVAYDNPAQLAYTLKGVDLIISTISGAPQLALVEAAAAAQVRHFIPSGFSGPEQCAPQNTTRTDWPDLITRLQFHEANSSMRYTVFTCGVFYEHFGPGGLNALQISTFNNHHASIGQEGEFLVDFRAGRATIPVIPHSDEAAICMTSARDVARYIVATLQAYEELKIWPSELKFCTERFTMSELLALCSRVRAPILGGPIAPQFTTPSSLNHALANAEQTLQPNPGNNRALSIARALAVAEFHPSLNFETAAINLTAEVLEYARTADSEPAPSEGFEEWLTKAWSMPTAPTPNTRASANTSGKTSGVSSRSGSSQKSKHSAPK